MKRFLILFLIIGGITATHVVQAQAPPTSVSKDIPDTDTVQHEVERLRSEIDRLRRERDAYRADLDRGEAHVSASLKALSAQLSKEIKEDFYGTVTRMLWIVGILVAVATAGGFWRMSDIITTRVNEKVDQKEKALQRLSDQLIDDFAKIKVNVAEKEKELERLSEQMREEISTFRREADEQRRKVRMVSEQVVTEMRSRVLEISYVVDSSGRPSTVLTQPEPAREAKKQRETDLPPGVTRVFPSGPDQYGYESLIDGESAGVFLYYFSKALLDPVADVDGDGKVSLQEAVLAARESLKKGGFEQDPDIVGPGTSVALFTLRKVSRVERPSGKVFAVLVGINEYSGGIPSLNGAVNDVFRFSKLLANRSHLLASEAVCHVLTDREATREHIEKEMQWLYTDSSSDDVVMFLFSGHATDIPDAKHKKKKMRVLVPHDAGDNLENCISEPDLLEQLSRISARARIYINA
jgi:hypothetical protein